MGLTDKLIDVDMYIWKQFEKVTVKANEELGWNKYDLAKIADTADTMTLSGASLYYLITGANTNSSLYLGIGISYSIMAGINHITLKTLAEIKEKSETTQLELTGVPKSPKFSPLRPLNFLASSFYIGYGADLLVNPNLLQYETEINSALGLATIAVGSNWIFKTISSYFRNQIMTPPSKKKKLWKLYDKITNSLKGEPKLVPQPKPIKYQTLEYVISD